MGMCNVCAEMGLEKALARFSREPWESSGIQWGTSLAKNCGGEELLVQKPWESVTGWQTSSQINPWSGPQVTSFLRSAPG